MALQTREAVLYCLDNSPPARPTKALFEHIQPACPWDLDYQRSDLEPQSGREARLHPR